MILNLTVRPFVVFLTLKKNPRIISCFLTLRVTIGVNVILSDQVILVARDLVG